MTTPYSTAYANRFTRSMVMGAERLYVVPYQLLSLEGGWTTPNYELRQVQDTLLGYYTSGGMYQELGIVGGGASDPTDYNKIKSLRNPVAAFVDFYRFKLFPNPLEPTVEEDSQYGAAIVERIQEIWKRSAFDRLKPKASFNFSLWGELFFSVGQNANKEPILQVLDDRHVVELDLNERSFITWIRQDIPFTKRDMDSGEETAHVLIDVWQEGRHRQWEIKEESYLTFKGKLPSLTPDKDEIYPDSLPIDFVPIAYAPFVQIGNERGISPLLTALEDIDEVNRMSTNLNAMLFRNKDGMWVVSANMVSASGQPLPAPDIADMEAGSGSVTLPDGSKVILLPGLSTLGHMVPILPYDQALAILNDQLEFIRENKLFELGYFDKSSNDAESGRAIAYRMKPALDRVGMGREGILDALARAHKMCFTVGQLAGLPDYSPSVIGTFENDDWEHDFAPQDLIIPSLEEMAQTTNMLVGAGAGFGGAAKTAGISQSQVDDMMEVDNNPPEQ